MFFEDEFDFFEKMNNDELSDFSPEMQKKLRDYSTPSGLRLAHVDLFK